ncbi:hypothetical protein FEM33_23190 [Dyadobacter flavalbus]|uniref:Uncharacterized protein n=1 Tax=Dyadobacter flavalbus TaxID=2579942 RepID=A0A5M8QDZ9_9BACT|nr:heparin lyase I family protein [Dyadobacter flavalbus]KAA6432632.1 hypothetical protein FEM33_23190 [Dyadobacter flavalbus]
MLAPVQAFDFREEPSSLNNNISFMRESEASYYGSDGYLHFAQPGRNWISQSHKLSLSPWVQVMAFAATTSDTLAPDGSGTACKITEEIKTGEHRISRIVPVPQGQPVTVSMYLKAGSRSKIQFSFSDSTSFTGGNPTVKLDLANGTFIAASSNLISYKAVNSGNGWWRLQLTAVPDLGSVSGFHVYILNDSSMASYAGVTGKYIYAWGAQMEPGINMTAYTPTAENPYMGLRYNYRLSNAAPLLAGALIEPESTNLIPYSQKLEGTPWRKQAASTPLSTVKSPDGETFGYKIKESTASSTTHYIVPNPTISTEAGNTYTLSAFFKAAERTWVYFNVSGLTIHFDIANGIVGNKSSIFIGSAVENAGNGWFRCAATFIASSSNTSTVIGCEISNGKQSYTGDGTSGVLIWGIQLEKAVAMTSYIRTNATPVTRKADIVTLNRPGSSSASDVFTQRTDGGNWIKQTSTNYQIEQSENEIQIINFYDSSMINSEHEDIAVNLFPEQFVSVGNAGTILSMFDKSYMTQTANKEWSLQKAMNKTSPLYRAVVNAGEVWSGDYTNKYRERSEFYMKGAQMPYDQDVWLSFAIKIEPGEALTLEPSDFCYLGQFHASEDEGDISSPPVLGFRLEGLDTFKAFTCSTTVTPHTVSPKSFLRGTSQFTRGIWHKNVMRIRFSPTNGQFQWWKDGVELVNISNIGIGYPDETGPYWKFGIYRSPMPQTVAVEYANMEVQFNTSLESRITNPLLIV